MTQSDYVLIKSRNLLTFHPFPIFCLLLRDKNFLKKSADYPMEPLLSGFCTL